MTTSINNLPAHVFDEVPKCADCGLEREVDDGVWVHMGGSVDCPPTIPAWVKYDATGITALICDGCLMVGERASEGQIPKGVEPIRDRGAVICKRCGQVAW